jgi:hypothetical protein
VAEDMAVTASLFMTRQDLCASINQSIPNALVFPQITLQNASRMMCLIK